MEDADAAGDRRTQRAHHGAWRSASAAIEAGTIVVPAPATASATSDSRWLVSTTTLAATPLRAITWSSSRRVDVPGGVASSGSLASAAWVSDGSSRRVPGGLTATTS